MERAAKTLSTLLAGFASAFVLFPVGTSRPVEQSIANRMHRNFARAGDHLRAAYAAESHAQEANDGQQAASARSRG